MGKYKRHYEPIPTEAVLRWVDREMHSAVRFAMEDVMWDFKVNKHGSLVLSISVPYSSPHFEVDTYKTKEWVVGARLKEEARDGFDMGPVYVAIEKLLPKKK